MKTFIAALFIFTTMNAFAGAKICDFLSKNSFGDHARSFGKGKQLEKQSAEIDKLRATECAAFRKTSVDF